MNIVASWSGGKDGCLAIFKAINKGYKVKRLFTFMKNDKMSNFHDLSIDLLEAQLNSIGFPFDKYVTDPENYEQIFKSLLKQFKNQGVDGIVTGDISEVELHEKGWLERICDEVGLTPIRPLWQCDTLQILRNFINSGFKATVVKVNLDVLNEQWLGRELNQQFLKDISKLNNVVDPCGENGEYHTVVTDGPFFSKRIKITQAKPIISGSYGQLRISKFKTMLKEEKIND